MIIKGKRDFKGETAEEEIEEYEVRPEFLEKLKKIRKEMYIRFKSIDELRKIIGKANGQ